ncbi:glycohydrolase toxin TNT-related protein [Actinomadura sp. LOL_016]|uniref:glycohydrolase toxin TNT-related protein n=1 Tax=unclassified Actinomadura TaxID=2626254 RepID=UPI003A805E3C
MASGHWSVMHGASGWQVVPGSTPDEPETFGSARSAVADAMARVLATADAGVTSGLLELAGIVKDLGAGKPFCELGDAGLRLKERSADREAVRPPGPCVPLGRLENRPTGYFRILPGPRPDAGAFATVHEIYELAARALLPGDPDENAGPGAWLGDGTAVDLAEGALLDGYGDRDQVFLFTPGTPFRRRGLWGSAGVHEHHRYRLRRPLRAHPGFPVATATLGNGDERAGQGYYLVETIAELVSAGVLVPADTAEES